MEECHHSSPVSLADSITSFWIPLNLGCFASGAKPRMMASQVVRKAPDCLSRSRAYFLSVIDLELTQSTGMWTSRPISRRSDTVNVRQGFSRFSLEKVWTIP